MWIWSSGEKYRQKIFTNAQLVDEAMDTEVIVQKNVSEEEKNQVQKVSI